MFDALFATARPETRGELTTVGDLREHLALLAQACREVAPSRARRVDTWIAIARQVADVASEVLDPLRDYAVVQSLVAALGSSWSLLDGDMRAPVVP